ncbi:hypothetical protein [Deinococcus ruber]|uniref:Toprim domain-containing protein n=1 Tax=Deinococcus ruber TaxID=1848197 RepID=A0A918F919_9DEIO|nr:hypothetical protein [Deinococcus ruber]GGR17195.1 hypothetical protein GCM10008957_32260 [Deinococcus ruber]
MSALDALTDHADLPALIRRLTGHAYQGLQASGGTIHDPRPGHQEDHPSFSIFKNRQGVWMWKRRGERGGVGTAYHLLLAFGYDHHQTIKYLSDLTGLSADTPATPLPPARPSRLKQAQDHRCPVPSQRDQHYAASGLLPLTAGTPAWLNLRRRGLHDSPVLRAAVLPHGPPQLGEDPLALGILHPDGHLLNVKLRTVNPTTSSSTKYRYRLAGLGSPAWVNPDYGHAPRLLIIEGELNAVAAFEAASSCGRYVDVQGIAGADSWPHLHDLQRDVSVYTDPDPSGDQAWIRLHDLLLEAGATSVQRLTPVANGDYCDVLGRDGPNALNALLDPPPLAPDPERSSGLAVPGEWPVRMYQLNSLYGER